MTAPDYVAQVAELLGQHELAQRYTVLDDVCRCGTTVKDHATHLAEVLAAAGLIPTHTEWGVRLKIGQVHSTVSGRRMDEEDARDIAGAIGVVASRAVTDWKDAGR